VEFHLSVTCTDDQTRDVTSQDLHSSDHDVVAVSNVQQQKDNGILIVKLRKGQEVKLRAIAKKVTRVSCSLINTCYKGVGKEHAKWSPVCTVTYQFEPDIRLNQARIDELPEAKKQEWHVDKCQFSYCCIGLIVVPPKFINTMKIQKK
jgi:DNA-directed RNA polymerase II subunit RPB3